MLGTVYCILYLYIVLLFHSEAKHLVLVHLRFVFREYRPDNLDIKKMGRSISNVFPNMGPPVSLFVSSVVFPVNPVYFCAVNASAARLQLVTHPKVSIYVMKVCVRIGGYPHVSCLFCFQNRYYCAKA